MSVLPSLVRNRSWVSFILTVVLLVASYETLQRLGQFSNTRDGGIEFDSSKDSPIPFPDPGKSNKKPDCEIVDQMRKENVTVVMRTGATEAYRKLPIQLLTTLRCFEPEDILLYSDLEDQMGEFKINDILSTVPDSKKKANKDFEIYYEIQNYKTRKLDFEKFPNEATEGHPGDPKAWTLDKYKFIHMLEESYHAKPDSKWFVFMEADTYFFWSNLILWLKALDSSKELYLGSVAQYGGNRFGHGGSGFIISKPALEKMIGPERGLAASWDEPMKNECCGDYVVGLLMSKAGVGVTQAWPMLNGEYPESMEFGPNKLWCEPTMTMHHIPTAEINGIWAWEKEQKHSTPLLLADIYTQFVAPEIAAKPSRISWDNLSNDVVHQSSSSESASEVEREAYLSAKNCNIACKADSSCLQYLWKSGEVKTKQAEPSDGASQENSQNSKSTCTFSKSIRLGKYRPDVVGSDWGEQWISGWDVEKINQWAEVNRCQEAKWVSGTL